MTTVNAEPETATLQMIRAEANTRELQRWMGMRRLQDTDHAMHCLLTECFGDLAPKPFRLIAPRRWVIPASCTATARLAPTTCGKRPAFTLTHCRPASSVPAHSTANQCPPSGRRANVWGSTFAFDPSCASSGTPPFAQKAQPKYPASRMAATGAARSATRSCGRRCSTRTGEGWSASREQVYAEWLSAQLDRIGGASLDVERTKLVSFQRTRAIRKLHARHSEGPDAVMRGILTITDASAFSNLLARGVGRHRAYGYGMLLLRPARA